MPRDHQGKPMPYLSQWQRSILKMEAMTLQDPPEKLVLKVRVYQLLHDSATTQLMPREVSWHDLELLDEGKVC